MQLNLSVSEMTERFKEINNNSEKLFEMIRIDVKETIGKYLSELMKVELSDFLGREHYQRKDCGNNTNHRNGYYGRRFTFNRIGELSLTVLRDRLNEFNTNVLPRSKRYEDDIRNDICLMYLIGECSRTLSMISSRLIGRKISHTEVSNTSKELIHTGETETLQERTSNIFLLTEYISV